MQSPNLALVPSLLYRVCLEGSGNMTEKTKIATLPRARLKQIVDAELAKFERREHAFRQAERNERATKLRLPLTATRYASIQSHERE
jgi:hypothetical protein